VRARDSAAGAWSLMLGRAGPRLRHRWARAGLFPPPAGEARSLAARYLAGPVATPGLGTRSAAKLAAAFAGCREAPAGSAL